MLLLSKPWGHELLSLAMVDHRLPRKARQRHVGISSCVPAAIAPDKRPQTRHGRTGDSRQGVVNRLQIRIGAASPLPAHAAENIIRRTRMQPFSPCCWLLEVPVRGPSRLGTEQRVERRQGAHQNRDSRLHVLPKEPPQNAHAARRVDLARPDNRHTDHEEVEAQEHAEADLLLRSYLGAVEDNYRDPCN